MSTDLPSKRGLAFRLASIVGKRIADGEYPPGELIKPDVLCITQGLSRTVVREALRILESKGMIHARPNVGTRVRPVEAWDLLDHDISVWVAGTEIGEALGKAAVELAAAVDRQPLPENPLYERLQRIVASYASCAPQTLDEPGHADGAEAGALG